MAYLCLLRPEGSTLLILVLAVMFAAAVFALVIVLGLAAAVFALAIVLGLAALAVVPAAVTAVVIRVSGRGGFRGRTKPWSRAGQADPLQIF